MRHRHLADREATPPTELGLAELDNLLERGDLDDWAPVLRAVRADPRGEVADRVLHLTERHPMRSTSSLWRSWIEELRREPVVPSPGEALRRLREERGLTQQAVAARLGMTQPEVSKLERRRDVRLSTMRAYVGALGGRLRLSARFPEGDTELD